MLQQNNARRFTAGLPGQAGARIGGPWLSRRGALAFGMLAVFLFACALPPNRAAATTGQQVMELVLARKTVRAISATLEMVVADQRRRKKSHTLAYFRVRGGKTIRTVVFGREPKILKNTAYLGHDSLEPGGKDRQWLYLPRTRKTREVEAAERASNFLGSAFTYADLMLPELEGYRHKLVGEREVDGARTWEVERLPASPEIAANAIYAKSVFWVRQDNHVVVRALHWLREGRLVKHLRVTGLEERDGVWLITEWRMATLWGRAPIHTTVMRLSGIKLDETFKADLFKPKRLKRGLK